MIWDERMSFIYHICWTEFYIQPYSGDIHVYIHTYNMCVFNDFTKDCDEEVSFYSELDANLPEKTSELHFWPHQITILLLCGTDKSFWKKANLWNLSCTVAFPKPLLELNLNLEFEMVHHMLNRHRNYALSWR